MANVVASLNEIGLLPWAEFGLLVMSYVADAITTDVTVHCSSYLHLIFILSSYYLHLIFMGRVWAVGDVLNVVAVSKYDVADAITIDVTVHF